MLCLSGFRNATFEVFGSLVEVQRHPLVRFNKNARGTVSVFAEPGLVRAHFTSHPLVLVALPPKLSTILQERSLWSSPPHLSLCQVSHQAPPRTSRSTECHTELQEHTPRRCTSTSSTHNKIEHATNCSTKYLKKVNLPA